MLGYACTCDQLNAKTSAALELAGRRWQLIMQAYRENPANPSRQGADLFLGRRGRARDGVEIRHRRGHPWRPNRLRLFSVDRVVIALRDRARIRFCFETNLGDSHSGSSEHSKPLRALHHYPIPQATESESQRCGHLLLASQRWVHLGLRFTEHEVRGQISCDVELRNARSELLNAPSPTDLDTGLFAAFSRASHSQSLNP